jgi:hypothetical protein
VSHNVVQDDAATKVVTDKICPASVDLLLATITKDPWRIGAAITSLTDVEGHDRSGPKTSGIVTDGKSLRAITTAFIGFDPKNPTGVFKDLAVEEIRNKLVDACAYTWVQAATTCTDGT